VPFEYITFIILINSNKIYRHVYEK